MLALCTVGLITGQFISNTSKMVHAISLLSIQHFGKRMGVKYTVLPHGQPPTVTFTVLAQLCGPKANETETCAAHSPKMVREGTLTLL